MRRQILKLTKKLIPECSGFGPNGFRHLVATNWLQKLPTDYPTVGDMLNDALEIVVRNYAHVRKDTFLAKPSADIVKLMAGQSEERVAK
jgi:hypothetical protein